MYILDYHRQLELIQEMTQLRKDDENWVVYYHHPTTNEMWKSFFPRANGKQKGPKLLRTEPIPEELDERFEECLTGTNRENAIGLGIEMSVNPAKWNQVLNIIEENYPRYDRQQLSLFFEHLGIKKPVNFFNELGYDPEDFGLDLTDLKSYKWRVRKIQLKRFLTFSSY